MKNQKMNKAENFVKKFFESKRGEILDRAQLAVACTRAVQEKFNIQGKMVPPEYRQAMKRFLFS